MRIYTLLLICVFIIQTAASQTESASTTTVSGVERMPKRSAYNSWEVGLQLGITYPNTDIAASDLNGDNVKNQLGYGLSVSKFFSHNFALQGNLMRCSFSGLDDRDRYGFSTQVNYEASLNAVFHIGNIGFLKRTPNFGLYGYVGIGIMNFSPENDSSGVSVPYNYYVTNSGLTRIDYDPTSEMVIPFGVGARYLFTKKFSAHIEYSLHTTRSDKLDGWYRLLSDNDAYSYFNIGLTYHIGKKDKTIEWVNPMQTIYTDLYDVKEKVDMMSGDKDKDGVADMFDRDNATPEGVKVYGDGTAVDTDGDGVPDYLDAEPFSAKGAKVDAQGRELDSDGDGIPDSRDLEPNTPKGTLVTNNGVAIPVSTSMSDIAAGYIPSIYFDLNSATISTKYNEILANIALLLRNYPSLKFDIVGNCDVRASESYNQELGNKRANAVKSHLIKKYNVDPARLTSNSKGKASPITQDHAMNRRVDFEIVK